MLFLIALLTFGATMVGGLFALRFRDKLHLILGFSAGAVVGVAFFDLLPEAFDIGSKFYDIPFIVSFVAAGFLAYLVLDRTIAIWFAHDSHDEHAGHIHIQPERGVLGASTLSFHSFLDGVAIGLSFQVSVAVGAVVTLAVLAHDFSDGINTVNVIVKNGGKRALRWLMVDALAPVVGIMLTMFVTLPESALGLVLAVFAGFFLYIGASDLIPESHHGHPRFLTTAMTILGAAVLYAIISIAQI